MLIDFCLILGTLLHEKNAQYDIDSPEEMRKKLFLTSYKTLGHLIT